MITQMKASNVLGAKTARACDSCLSRRARWFCGADDAFLCHVCDNSVHSANQLASRHERVRLQTASSTKANRSWYSGFTRKARTPRHNKHLSLQQQRPKHEEEEVLFSNINTLPVVPELGGEETLLDESDEQLLFRVPVFEPFEAELCNIYSEAGDKRLETAMKDNVADDEATCGLDNFSEFLPSDMDLAEFTADVKSLLGTELDEDSREMKASEVPFDCKQEDDIDAYLGAKSGMVKVKDEQIEGVSDCRLDSVLDMTSDALNWNIDSESPVAAAQEEEEQEEEEKVVVPVAANDSGLSKVGTKRKVFLRLKYEEVIRAWATQGSPWTTGNPPDFNSGDCWPDFSVWSGGDVEVGSLKGGVLVLGTNKDEGREARVTRYREKRRTRLFAKKIRYQVRKLNAEKRPRMKGRFVKRTSYLQLTCMNQPL